jgi:hypothetical protein
VYAQEVLPEIDPERAAELTDGVVVESRPATDQKDLLQ